VVEKLLNGGNTVNLCSIDLSKAFDKVNHHALLMKLIKRNLPVDLLDLLDNWLQNCFSCVKWNHVLSHTFMVKFGVRQGSVLSPYLFAIYLDDIPVFRSLIPRSFVVMYADDILLIAPSCGELQLLFQACECELNALDMCINTKKSCCIRIGPRCDMATANISTSNGHTLPWANEIRYLGMYITAGRHLRCSTSYAKRSFHRSINAIFGKVGRIASEEVVLELVRSKCMPILLYGLECFFLPKSDVKSLDFAVTRFLMKLFRTANYDVILDCCKFFEFTLPSEYLVKKSEKFIVQYKNCSSLHWYFAITVN